MGLFLRCLLILLICNVFISVPGSSGYCCSVEHFWSQVVWWLHFFCLRYLIYSGSFLISHKSGDSLFYFYKVGYWYFDKDCMESANHFELYGHFNNINLPVHEHGHHPAFCIFNFIYQWPIVFRREKFCLPKFIPKYFICCIYWIWDYFLCFSD